MEDLKKTIKDLLKQAGEDQYKKYDDKWRSEAVYALNEYYFENYPDDTIYEVEGDEFEDIVKMRLENTGAIGVKCLLDGIDGSTNYARLDGYGNATSVDFDLVELLEDVLKEL